MNCLKEQKVWLDSPGDYCEILANIILNLCFISFPLCFNFKSVTNTLQCSLSKSEMQEELDT